MSTEFYNRNWRMPKSSNLNKVSNYSMSFDGSSEYIDINPSITTSNEYSISTWINSNDLTSSSFGYIIQTTGNKGIGIDEGSGHFGAGKFYYWNGSTSTTISTTAITVNNWFNVVFIFNKTANQIKFYLNGNLDKTTTVTSITGDINKIGNLLTHYINAKLDHFAIFDYALSASQITSLYGNSTDGVGNPMALSTKPVAYYKLGEKAAFNGSEYLVTNAASEVYSPYALNCDGTDDYIDLDNAVSLNSSGYSLSIWFNSNSFLAIQVLFTNAASNIKFVSINNATTIRVRDGVNQREFTVPTLSTGVWYNLIVVVDNSSCQVYLNSNISSTTAQVVNQNWSIDAINGYSNFHGGSFNFNGLLSNASVWNAALTSTQVTELYATGTPTNLNNHSAYSNLVSWWQLGENMSYDGTKWTVLDEKGTNNGEGTNLGPAESSIVNGVGTSANGLSSGMGGADNIIGDAPYSTANAVSYGMGLDALSSDVPS